MINIRKSFKTKILFSTIAIVSISLILSGIIAFIYCFVQLEKQSIEDEKTILNGTARQLDYFLNDIADFSLSVALDDAVQSYIHDKKQYDGYEEYKTKERISRILSGKEVQRLYIANIAIIRENDMIISASQVFLVLDELHYRERLKEDWYIKAEKKESIKFFSDPYMLKTITNNDITVIPYILNLVNINKPEEILGRMIVNIRYDSLTNYLTVNEEHYNFFYLFNEDQEMVYSNSHSEQPDNIEEVSNLVKSMQNQSIQIYKKPSEYVIVDRTLSNGWALFASVPYSRIYENTKPVLIFFTLFIMTMLLITVSVITKLIAGVTKPLNVLVESMERVSKGQMDVQIDTSREDEFGLLSKCFSQMMYELKKSIEELVHYQEEKRNIEISLMMAQINPHFIYNTLQTVIYMANKEQCKQIEDMVKSFIHVLQDVVCIGVNGLLTTLAIEIEVVRQYLNIQNYRYRDKFNVLFDIDEDLKSCMVPRTIIQPIVENCLYHGILASEMHGTIKIAVHRSENEEMIITVEDNGVGMSQEEIDKVLVEKVPYDKMRTIGISNIRHRINYICGKKYTIAIDSKINEYTRYLINLPTNLSQ
jgi:two-component system sensor histidine kinase YesM